MPSLRGEGTPERGVEDISTARCQSWSRQSFFGEMYIASALHAGFSLRLIAWTRQAPLAAYKAMHLWDPLSGDSIGVACPTVGQ